MTDEARPFPKSSQLARGERRYRRGAPYFGDDVADNIVPLCRTCHAAIAVRGSLECRELAESLTDAEYAYLIGKLGEGALERLYRVGR